MFLLKASGHCWYSYTNMDLSWKIKLGGCIYNSIPQRIIKCWLFLIIHFIVSINVVDNCISKCHGTFLHKSICWWHLSLLSVLHWVHFHFLHEAEVKSTSHKNKKRKYYSNVSLCRITILSWYWLYVLNTCDLWMYDLI